MLGKSTRQGPSSSTANELRINTSHLYNGDRIFPGLVAFDPPVELPDMYYIIACTSIFYCLHYPFRYSLLWDGITLGYHIVGEEQLDVPSLESLVLSMENLRVLFTHRRWRPGWTSPCIDSTSIGCVAWNCVFTLGRNPTFWKQQNSFIWHCQIRFLVVMRMELRGCSLCWCNC